jgi:hypothetical protein
LKQKVCESLSDFQWDLAMNSELFFFCDKSVNLIPISSGSRHCQTLLAFCDRAHFQQEIILKHFWYFTFGWLKHCKYCLLQSSKPYLLTLSLSLQAKLHATLKKRLAASKPQP